MIKLHNEYTRSPTRKRPLASVCIWGHTCFALNDITQEMNFSVAQTTMKVLRMSLTPIYKVVGEEVNELSRLVLRIRKY